MDPFSQPGAFSWCELMTSDPEAAKAFYQALFGWTFKPGDVGSIPYTVIEVNGQGIGGITPLPPNSQSPTWGTYVTVNNVEETIAKTEALGGKALIGPIEISPEMRFALIQDPQGAALAVISYGQSPKSPA
ncbi:MAG: VOC family protein [Prochlorotrichaceae cyanobacterium]